MLSDFPLAAIWEDSEPDSFGPHSIGAVPVPDLNEGEGTFQNVSVAPLSIMPWAFEQDEKGIAYWFKAETGESHLNTDPARLACSWSAVLDEFGRTFYQNVVTEDVVWELPEGASVVAGTWSALLDSGDRYFRDDTTYEVAWELPDGAVLNNTCAPAATDSEAPIAGAISGAVIAPTARREEGAFLAVVACAFPFES